MNINAPTIFGTDGIRKTVGTYPLSQQYLPSLGRAIACWAQKKYGASPIIIMGNDTRTSCDYIKASLQSGLLLSPMTIYDAHIIPTPALHLLTKQKSFINCGIMISASHNPYQDNGIKIIDGQQSKITNEDEECINKFFNEAHPIKYDSFGSLQHWPNALSEYAEKITAYFKPTLLKGKKIVLDCAHGATYKAAPEIFKQLGAELIVINNQPNGKNINEHSGTVDPSLLQKIVLDHQADAGFAFDGDGDRLAVLSSTGEIKDGDDIMAMLLTGSYYSSHTSFVGTIMTNKGLEKKLIDNNKTLIRSSVGDKHVLQQLLNHDLLLGSEPSGHIIMRDYLDISDGIFTALRLSEILTETDNWRMHSFIKYPQILINIPVGTKKDLSEPEIKDIIEQHNKKLIAGRIVVRYSGTENLLRIMVEDETKKQALCIANQLATHLNKQLS